MAKKMDVPAITYRLAFQTWFKGFFMRPEAPVAGAATCRRLDIK